MWLTFSWDNFFPICSECLPQNKAYFPVRGARAPAPSFPSSDQDGAAAAPTSGSGIELQESPLLIYPGELERPWTSFDVQIDGQLSPVRGNRRARETIKHFSLNRPDLMAERAAALQSVISDLERGRPFPSRLQEMAFGGAVFLMLRRLVKAVQPLRDTDPRLGADRIADTLSGLMSADRLPEDLRSLLSGRTPSPPSPPSGPKEMAPVVVRPPMPRLKRVEIRNFKSLESVSFDIPLALASEDPNAQASRQTVPSILILGENAAGKSSLLEAVALACSTEDEIKTLDLGKKRFLLDPAAMGSPELPSPTQAAITLSFDQGVSREARIDAQNHVHLSSTPDSPTPIVFAYGAMRLFRPKNAKRGRSRLETLFHLQRTIPNPEPWLIQLHKHEPAMLREVVSALRYVIEIDGEFETFEVRPDEDGTEHCYIRIRRTLADGREPTVLLRLEVISSGYRAILALICDVLRGLIEVSYVPPGARSSDSQKAKAVREAREAKAIVLVDEIEAHMHPRWKLNIVSGLRQAFPGVTFLLTSHDPLCVRGMDPKEVLVLNRYLDAAGGMLEKVEAVQDRINTRAMTVEQLLTSRLFQLFSTDDMKMDRWFAEASGQLSQRESLTEEDEKAVVGRLQQEIGAGLPFGRSEVTSLVQEAVSEYLQLRRDSDSGTVSEARARAKSRVRAFLTGLLE